MGVIIWRPDGDDEVASIACLPGEDVGSQSDGTGKNGQGKMAASSSGANGHDGSAVDP